ncbi:hypothetical protein AS593_13145 [Caulobacter vibrioides]|nr:hypothetical protein AS593_13145 [Caulobacter vibrioides]
MERLHDFLFEKNPRAAARLIETLDKAFASLGSASDRGRDLGEGLRELIVRFGGRSYVVRYGSDEDGVIIARIWHGLEQR